MMRDQSSTMNGAMVPVTPVHVLPMSHARGKMEPLYRNIRDITPRLMEEISTRWTEETGLFQKAGLSVVVASLMSVPLLAAYVPEPWVFFPTLAGVLVTNVAAIWSGRRMLRRFLEQEGFSRSLARKIAQRNTQIIATREGLLGCMTEVTRPGMVSEVC